MRLLQPTPRSLSLSRPSTAAGVSAAAPDSAVWYWCPCSRQCWTWPGTGSACRRRSAAPNRWRRSRASDSRHWWVGRERNQSRCPCAVSPDSRHGPAWWAPAEWHPARCRSGVRWTGRCRAGSRKWRDGVRWSRRRARAAGRSNREREIRLIALPLTARSTAVGTYPFPVDRLRNRCFLVVLHNHHGFQAGHFAECGWVRIILQVKIKLGTHEYR